MDCKIAMAYYELCHVVSIVKWTYEIKHQGVYSLEWTEITTR